MDVETNVRGTPCFAFWALVIFVIIWALFDNFTRKDHGGLAKALWFLFILFAPLIGVFVYLIARPADPDAVVVVGDRR